MSKRLFIISGEASGDLHGSNLIKSLKAESSDLTIQGWGGDLMEAAGMELKEHYKNLAFMGFAEVILNIRTILRNFKRCKAQISEFKPDAVIFIDYPGFNLRMAKFVKGLGIKSLYYISPQVWAWKQSRVKKIKAYVDEMFVILPFEKPFYEKHGIDAHYVGHPLLDVISPEKSLEEFITKNELDKKPIIAVLPGSRAQEIDRMLSVMLEAGKSFTHHQLVIAGAPGKTEDDYKKYLNKDVKLVFNQTYDLFKVAEAGWVTSGTATLEAALHGMPQAVIYKANSMSYRIAKRLIKIKFISLVNLIMDKEIVKELIQHEASVEALMLEMERLINDFEYQNSMLNNYSDLKKLLGNDGASLKTARLMLKTINA